MMSDRSFSPMDQQVVLRTIEYVDRIFGPGMGARHVRFLDRLENPALRDMIHRYHTVESDTRWLSLEDNYLIGMCVLCAVDQLETASMFAKTLLHLGVPKQRLLEAAGRLSMWVGGLPAVRSSFAIQKATRDYEQNGLASLSVWFPGVEEAE
jgi:hypothetical protein